MFTALCRTVFVFVFVAKLLAGNLIAFAQTQANAPTAEQATVSSERSVQNDGMAFSQFAGFAGARDANSFNGDYRVGAGDLLEISVMEAPELSRAARISESGQISMSLLGVIPAAGKTPTQLESLLELLLRRRYMIDPHVSVFVKEMQSHSVAILGAVKKPGVYQLRAPKRLVEVLSMAEGLADDAGDTALIIHQTDVSDPLREFLSEMNGNEVAAGPDAASSRELQPELEANSKQFFQQPATQEISLKSLLDSDDPASNVLVFPADEVKVTRAGVVYVVGEVKKSGGFQLKSNENISVLQALALAEGLTSTSARSRARIIRTDIATGSRTEMPIDLGKVLSGKVADPGLQPRDILFVPNSTGRSALYRSIESAFSIGTGLALYRR